MSAEKHGLIKGVTITCHACGALLGENGHRRPDCPALVEGAKLFDRLFGTDESKDDPLVNAIRQTQKNVPRE